MKNLTITDDVRTITARENGIVSIEYIRDDGTRYTEFAAHEPEGLFHSLLVEDRYTDKVAGPSITVSLNSSYGGVLKAEFRSSTFSTTTSGELNTVVIMLLEARTKLAEYEALAS